MKEETTAPQLRRLTYSELTARSQELRVKAEEILAEMNEVERLMKEFRNDDASYSRRNLLS